jgi:hypothetical protein
MPAAATPQSPTANSEQPLAEEAPQLVKLTTYQSMMYSKEDQALLNEVLDAIQKNQPLPGIELIPAPTTEEDVEEEPEIQIESRYYRYPQFYLTSIAYFQPENWVIWVNGKKITSRQKKVIRRLKINEVSANQVVFESTLLPEDRSDFSSPSDDERISINESDRIVTFMLKPNQTFSSYNWKIYEGKVKQVKEPTKKESSPTNSMLPNLSDIFSGGSPPSPGSNPGVGISVPPQAAPSGVTPIAPQGQTGISGLINRSESIINPISPAPQQTLPQSRPNTP